MGYSMCIHSSYIYSIHDACLFKKPNRINLSGDAYVAHKNIIERAV